MDNDGDGKTDQSDAGCAMNPVTEFTDQVTAAGRTIPASCNDALDNDANNVRDFVDPGCIMQRLLAGTAGEVMSQ